MTEMPRTPDVAVQRAAMKKLEFLVGEWVGEASVLRGPGQFVELVQTESARFRLDGLLLEIEGVGRAKSGGGAVLQALGLICFDDAAGAYRMRAFNDGRWLESEVVMVEGERSISWGFAVGEIRTKTVLRMNEEGEWTEFGELTIGERGPMKMMDLRVRRVLGAEATAEADSPRK